MQVQNKKLDPAPFCRGISTPEFCLLVDAKPDLVRNSDNEIGVLPFHWLCWWKGRVETVQYLFSLYPESNNIPSMLYPIKLMAVAYPSSDYNGLFIELAKFPLQLQIAAVSRGRVCY